MRCHGVHLNAYVASEIKRATGIPYVVSFHGNPDLDLRHHWKGRDGDWRALLGLEATVAIERVAIPVLTVSSASTALSSPMRGAWGPGVSR